MIPTFPQVLVGEIKGMVVEMKGTPILCCTNGSKCLGLKRRCAERCGFPNNRPVLDFVPRLVHKGKVQDNECSDVRCYVAVRDKGRAAMAAVTMLLKLCVE